MAAEHGKGMASQVQRVNRPLTGRHSLYACMASQLLSVPPPSLSLTPSL